MEIGGVREEEKIWKEGMSGDVTTNTTCITTATPASVSAPTVDSCSDLGESVGESSVTWCCSSSGYHSYSTQHHHLNTTTTSTTATKPLPYPGDEDDDSDDDSAWGDDEWPPERPLPLPEWGCGRPALEFTSTLAYTRFLACVSSRLRHALAHQPYDSLSNFIMFAQEYRSSGYTHLQEFYRDYDPPLVPGRYTCVGLAADLASRLADLEAQYPGLKDAVYQVSCEEELTDEEITDVTSTDTPSASQSFIEHVLLCVRVHVEGRSGVVLLDPGYHVPRPITVMEDGLPPHSGPVLAATTRSDVTRSFRYYFPPSSKSYVVWEVEEERGGRLGGGKKSVTRSLVHVSRPFLSGVDVAERRNLAYTFKTLMGRDATGAFTGGLYFAIKPPPTLPPPPPALPSSSETPSSSPESSRSSSSTPSTTITLFHKLNGEMKFVKTPLAYFLPPPEDKEEEENYREDKQQEGGQKRDEGKRKIDVEVEAAVCGVEVAVGRADGDLRDALTALASLLHHHAFLSDLLDLNGALEALGEP